MEHEIAAISIAYSKSILALNAAAFVFFGMVIDASACFIARMNIRTPPQKMALIYLWAFAPRRNFYLGLIIVILLSLLLSWYWMSDFGIDEVTRQLNNTAAP